MQTQSNTIAQARSGRSIVQLVNYVLVSTVIFLGYLKQTNIHILRKADVQGKLHSVSLSQLNNKAYCITTKTKSIMSKFGFSGGTSSNPSPAPTENITAISAGDGLVAPDNDDITPIEHSSSSTPAPAAPVPPVVPVVPPTPAAPVPPVAPVPAEHGLIDGTIVEVGESKYTVNDKGDLLDDKGTVFKAAADVKSFIDSLDQVDDAALNIENIQKLVGIELVGEDDKPLVFDETPAGVAAYINGVIENQQDEYAQAGVNNLLARYPFVSDAINYYLANGNNLDGWGTAPDRSTITLDENNAAQHEHIIRESFKETGRTSGVDTYIDYLKANNLLYDTAKTELAAMTERDVKAKAETAAAAQAAAQKEAQETADYWNAVKTTITGRKIAGYEIPETIIINRDGKKTASTPTDFFNYLYNVDANGVSRYTKDLETVTPEQQREDEILRAYLKYTGSSYSDLVAMAIKNEEANKLRYKVRSATTQGTVKVTPPAAPAVGGKKQYGY